MGGHGEDPVHAGGGVRDLRGGAALFLQQQDQPEQADLLDRGGQSGRGEGLPQLGVAAGAGFGEALVGGEIGEDPGGETGRGGLLLGGVEVHQPWLPRKTGSSRPASTRRNSSWTGRPMRTLS